MAAVFVILLALLAVCRITYNMAFYVSPRRQSKYLPLPGREQYAAVKHITDPLMAQMEALPYETVSIPSRDGLMLYARYYHVSNGAPLQIQFHGYRSGPIRDFCGGNKLARGMGHNTLVVDQRAHGESEGRTISFGVLERFDALDWARYAQERWPDVPVLFSGVSMGAATVIMAAGLDLPGNVCGVIADCPYASPDGIITKVCRDIRIPPALGMFFIRAGARIFGRFRLRSADAVGAAKDTKVPVMILHGEEDKFVPVQMSREIESANPGMVELHTFPGAGHGLSYIVNAPRYEQLTREFVEKCIGKQE